MAEIDYMLEPNILSNINSQNNILGEKSYDLN